MKPAPLFVRTAEAECNLNVTDQAGDVRAIGAFKFGWIRRHVASWIAIWLGVSGWLASAQSPSSETVWDYDPYRVKIWISLDPGVRLPWRDREQLLRDVELRAENSFGAAWRVDAAWTPLWQHQLLIEEWEGLSLAKLSSRDAVLILSKENKEHNAIRSIETAIERLEQIQLAAPDLATIESSARDSNDLSLKSFLAKLRPSESTASELMAAVEAGNAECVLVHAHAAEKISKNLRKVPVRLPWQIDAIEKGYDKLVLVAISKEGQRWLVRTREFDCPMQYMGPSIQHETTQGELLPRLIEHHLLATFTPVVRVDNVRSKRASMRLRAGGMIIQSEHPALIYPGDVLMPFMRLDDKAGVPTLLDRVPWTYVAVSEGDGIKFEGLVISGVQGGMEGRTNRRTQRVALRVRPTFQATDIRFTVRGMEQVTLPGIAVYQRGPTGGDLQLIGHSDWRGKIPVESRETSTMEIKAPNVARTTAASSDSMRQNMAGAVAISSEVGSATLSGTEVAQSASNPEASAEAAAPETLLGVGEPPKVEPEVPPQVVPLNVPLYLYYVKNGDMVLARLPIVTGLFEQETADLPDDRRRLEAEAFIRGLQTEIFDAIVIRKILQMRIEKMIAGNNSVAARDLLKQLRSAPSYERISEKLEAIQRKIFDPERGQMPLGAGPRIDSMILETRQIMQKYLQDTTDRSFELQLDELEKGGSPSS